MEELTRHNVVEKDLKSDVAFVKERVENNIALRRMMKKRGVEFKILLEGIHKMNKSEERYKRRNK